VQTLSRILIAVPWIKLLAVTGSAAAYNSDRDSDIDIFVIAKTHRLWLTRGFVAALLKTMGIYTQKDNEAGKVCPNLFIDEEAFSWSEKDRSIFTAHEIALMHPIIDRNQTYLKFLRANNWIKDHFANISVSNEEIKSKNSRNGSRLVNLLEKFAAYLQQSYMKKKITSEVIDKHLIHFRKNDNTNWILESYKKLSK
jgi:hypothetical protein